MKYIDGIALLVCVICGLGCEAEGTELKIILAAFAVCSIYLSIRLHVRAKEERRKEYWQNRKAIFDIEERYRREGF